MLTRCGRCGVVLTLDELEAQRYDSRFRCNACDCVTGTSDFLTCAAIHAPSKAESHDEWVRRVNLATRTFSTPFG